jgi:DNA-binding LacI/PurR family transcriptional regulator
VTSGDCLIHAPCTAKLEDLGPKDAEQLRCRQRSTGVGFHVGAVLKKRVEDAIRKLNYRPNSLAQSLARERTHTIGVIVPDISNPFFPMVVRGAEDAAQKQGYSILLCNSDGILEKEELYLELLLSKRVDGILLTKSPGELSARVRRMIADRKVPCVLMMRTYPILTEDAVITDDLKGSFDAVSHLARVGHKRIAAIIERFKQELILARQGAECERSEIRVGILIEIVSPKKIKDLTRQNQAKSGKIRNPGATRSESATTNDCSST